MKICNICGLEKAIFEFYSGHAKCKSCYYELKKKPYNQQNKEKINEAVKKSYLKHPNRWKDYNDRWKLDNALRHKAYKSKHNSEYYQKNKGSCNARHRAYEAAKIQRTPKWLTKEQLKEIEEFYILAQELSWLSEGGLHVDHIIPLRGENISGLHVPSNLQIIPAKENLKKRNKY